MDWEIWSHHADFSLPHRKKRARWVCQEIAQEDPTAGPSKSPRYHGAPRELLLCLTQPEPRSPVSHPDSGPHILQVDLPWPEAVISNQPGDAASCPQNVAQSPASGGTWSAKEYSSFPKTGKLDVEIVVQPSEWEPAA